MRYILAGYARFLQTHPIFMRVNNGLSYGQRVSIDRVNEKRALKRGTIARNHRKGVGSQNVIRFQFARGDRVVGTIGVDT